MGLTTVSGGGVGGRVTWRPDPVSVELERRFTLSVIKFQCRHAALWATALRLIIYSFLL